MASESVKRLEVILHQGVIHYRDSHGAWHMAIGDEVPPELVSAFLDLPTHEIAELAGVSERTARRYRNGECNHQKLLAVVLDWSKARGV